MTTQKNIFIFLWITSSLFTIEGQSTQLVGPGPVCSNDVATYQCTRSGSFISWRVTSTCGTDSISRGFNTFIPVGFSNNVRLCNSTLVFTLTSTTSSSISSNLTIDKPLLLNGTRITCRDETVQLLVVTSFNLVPPSTISINCTPYCEVSHFSLTWQPQNMRDFTVIVYPNRTFNSTTPITFQYEHVIPFTISLVQNDCTEDVTTTFILSCRLLNDYCANNVTYIVHVNGNMSARLETMEGERMLICINNHWREATPISTIKTEPLTTMSTTSVNFNECDSGNMNSYYLLLSGIIPTIISAIISAIVTAVILRLCCELKCRSKKKTSFSKILHIFLKVPFKMLQDHFKKKLT